MTAPIHDDDEGRTIAAVAQLLNFVTTFAGACELCDVETPDLVYWPWPLAGTVIAVCPDCAVSGLLAGVFEPEGTYAI